MIVIREECGKKYKIDTSKMRGDTARSRCKACGQVITIRRPKAHFTDQALDRRDRTHKRG